MKKVHWNLTGSQEASAYWFVLKAANGKVLLTSGTYTSKRGAMNGIKQVEREFAYADCDLQVFDHIDYT